MLSSVLKSAIAAQRSVQIMRAFSALEEATKEATSPQNEGLPSTIPEGMMTISKDDYISLQQRYIDLQQDKINMLERQYTKKPRKKSRPLTDADRAEIIELKKQGHSQAEIARMTGRSSATVSFILNLTEA
jgi:DNA-directed RNA polymerase specialized sigma24 family protein